MVSAKESKIETFANCFSIKLRKILRDRKISESKLAEAVGLPYMTIKRLTSGETTDPRISTLRLIGDYLNVSLDVLSDSNNKLYTEAVVRSKKSFTIPILDWETALDMYSIQELDLQNWKRWQTVTAKDDAYLSENCFVLESLPSMQHRFPHGTLLVINPNLKEMDGDLILVKIKDGSAITLKELSIEPPEKNLLPISSDKKILHFSEKEHEIVGVVVLTLFYNRKPTD